MDSSLPVKAIDLDYLGTSRVIAAHLVDGWIVDPGPANCLGVLLDGIESRPKGLLLTHIHLDHAGAAGTLARRFPGMPVYVHSVGAPHMADPARLLDSAGRLFGPFNMRRLWGEVAPVAAASLRPLDGGEQVGPFRAIHTPGHASHHLAYLHVESGAVFTGDVAGVRIAGTSSPSPLVMPTPPPDIDLAAWRESLGRLAALGPTSLHLAHFGAVTEPEAHLASAVAELDRIEALARLGEEAFAADVAQRMDGLDEGLRASLELAATPAHLYPGLDRYLRRLAARPPDQLP